MAKNGKEPRDLVSGKQGGALIGGVALNGEFMVLVKKKGHNQTAIKDHDQLYKILHMF